MDSHVSATRRDRRHFFMAVVGVGLLAVLVGAPVVEAASRVTTVKVKGPVKITDSNAQTIESEEIPNMGLLDAEGSTGAIAVRNFAGGTGLLGTADCTPDATTSRPNTVDVESGPDEIITGIIITGPDAKVAVRTPDLEPVIGPFPVNTFQTTPENPNVFVGLGTGLTVFPSNILFTCTGADGGPGSGNITVLGQGSLQSK